MTSIENSKTPPFICESSSGLSMYPMRRLKASMNHRQSIRLLLLLCISITVSSFTTTPFSFYQTKAIRTHQRILNVSPPPPSRKCTRRTTSSYLSSSSKTDAGVVPFETPPKEKLSKLELEFQDMMNEFKSYTGWDIACVQDPRYRALFQGVSAGGSEPAVYRAFVVLFEDYAPIRIAGRMIYRHLRGVMTKNREQCALETENISSRTGLTEADIMYGRKAFMAIKDDGEGELTMEQLIDAGIIETVMELSGYDSFDEFMSVMNHQKADKFDFETFMISLQRCVDCNDDAVCNIATVFEEVDKRMGPIEERRKALPLDQRKKKYAEKYDYMVKSFQEWEDLVPKGDGRKLDVLKGCFVGARNQQVVNALRIVYLDYSALRMAGNLIFQLTANMVGKKSKA